VAGVFSTSIMAPGERIKCLLQVSNYINHLFQSSLLCEIVKWLVSFCNLLVKPGSLTVHVHKQFFFSGIWLFI